MQVIVIRSLQDLAKSLAGSWNLWGQVMGTVLN